MLIDLWGCMLRSTRVIGLRRFRFEEDQQGKVKLGISMVEVVNNFDEARVQSFPPPNKLVFSFCNRYHKRITHIR